MTVIDASDGRAPASFAEPDYPRNAWYAAAWDVEVKHEMLARTICGQNLTLYRRADGNPVALQDACWHRLFPLSKGWLRGDDVVCGYHGLEYNPQGRCIYMPSQETINPAAMVRSYPAVERHRFVWVWPGDPALADPALIPDMHWNDDPEWAADGELIHVQCGYKLVIDNLMDLTHETYVHSTTIGNEHITAAPFDVTHGDNTVTVTRWMLDSQPPPLWEAMLGRPGNVDRWQIITFEAPSTIVIDVGVAVAGTGAPDGDRSDGVGTMVLNTITPERDGTCHYFWSLARNFKIDKQRITTERRLAVAGVFAEDEAVLEAQQRAIDASPGREFYNLNIDAGAMWARRLIDTRIAAERPAPAGANGRGPAYPETPRPADGPEPADVNARADRTTRG